MEDTIDEIKATLPVETTAAYAGIMAIANRDGDASNIFVMSLIFFILLICTIALSLIRTTNWGPLILAITGFVVWVANVDFNRASNFIANSYVEYISGHTDDPSFFTESLDITIPGAAIVYSVFLTIVSVYRAAKGRQKVRGLQGADGGV